MVRYLLGRLAGALMVVFVISVVTFAIFQLAPRLTGANLAFFYTGKNTSEAQAAAVAQKFGFDRPLPEQYWTFMSGIVAGRDLSDGATEVHCAAPCLGYSFRQNRPVLEMIGEAFPVTLGLTVGAAVLWLLFGVASGVLSAVRRGSVFDRLATTVALVGVSVPEFFTGMLLIYLLTSGPAWLRWYPDGINYVAFTDDPVGWFVNMIPPWICLALLFAALYARLTRATMLETMGEDYVRTAWAKGLAPRVVIGRHGLRAALPRWSPSWGWTSARCSAARCSSRRCSASPAWAGWPTPPSPNRTYR
ncbi:ABC transporter permease [Phytohabitans rumicis]|uniref:ABC transporter permease n=1 Tax=Phytohabitans rumicis TaxID=1076125 RepID=A0A6V8LEZ7_9ACTN|nr:ABC transporter permease [Phytohabitans rumicis]